jgi:hypothetical protein
VTAVLVLVAAALWSVVPVVEEDELEDDVELELLVVAEALEVLVPLLLTSDFPEPYEPEVPRLPRKRGAINAANFSALTMPLTRMVFSRSPVRMVAIRSVTASGLAAAICLLANHARPPTAATVRHTTSQRPFPRGFSGAGRSSSGASGFPWSEGPGKLGTEALLM